MPGLVRKILIFAAVDGLVLQPLAQRGQRPVPATKIGYKNNHITPVLNADGDKGENGKSFEAFGVVGLLTISKTSFLISITRRQQVAQIRGKPVYVVTEVALTPLASKADAESSITSTQVALRTNINEGNHAMDDSDTDDDIGEPSTAISDDVEDETPVVAPDSSSTSSEHKRTSSIAEDVMTRKGGYGRFAHKWFSKKGWTVDQRRNLGMTGSQSSLPTEPAQAQVATSQSPLKHESEDAASIKEQKANEIAANLLPKLLRTTQILFGSSRSFYFSYDFDITRRLATQKSFNLELPLHTQVDPLYFWNRNVIQPFIDAGQTSLVIPLMQGFVGQRSFEMDSNPPKPVIGMDGADQKSSMELSDLSRPGNAASDPNSPRSSGSSNSQRHFLLTLISRRSVKRGGLRYLRRGIDEDGNVANNVETEQLLSDDSWSPSGKIHSFVQVRGSIPVYFSQSPYSFKPIPQLQHSSEMNYRAFTKHFEKLSDTYGFVQIANLVEKHGPEAVVGDQYKKNLEQLNEVGGIGGALIGFEWFDFHAMCRGMHFENVSHLMDSLGKTLDAFNETVEVDGKQISCQKGVLRTNCMDCLDRTNVTQSACGRRALELQMKDEGIDMSLQVDQATQWFNTLWADNGDAISKQYASTAALKGDFTRTRKRDFQGALKDMGLSISRFYSGIVNDYFSQITIDFLLGNVTYVVFEDFEINLMSSDPGVSMQKLRQHAIDMCQRLVIADEQEEMIGGWTLLTPQISNTIKSTPFEESVLVLTDAALYCCKFDWNIEKVSSFERVDLQHITAIKYGTYITSTLSAAQVDEQRNVGLVITYTAGVNDITRVNTRSMSSIPSRGETDLLGGTSTSTAPLTAPAKSGKAKDKAPEPTISVLALKALPSRSAVADRNDSSSQLSEIEQIKAVCEAIERMVLHGQVVEVGTERKKLVERGDIISLADAKRSTGLLEQLSHSIKKLVWA